jgi:hypothetical protein
MKFIASQEKNKAMHHKEENIDHKKAEKRLPERKKTTSN